MDKQISILRCFFHIITQGFKFYTTGYNKKSSIFGSYVRFLQRCNTRTT